MTSSAKTVAVRGVPKSAAKTALMPESVAMRMSLSSRRQSRPTALPRLPPICRAAPSRPALPPKRWVMTVARKIVGTSASGTLSPCWIESMTVLVFLFAVCRKV